MNESKQTPHVTRCGWLRNGNPPGDFSKTPRCGAKTRHGTPCNGRAMPNGRCRLHGGLSTGPTTREGIERIRQAVTKHGKYSAKAKAERLNLKALLRDARAWLGRVHAEIAD